MMRQLMIILSLLLCMTPGVHAQYTLTGKIEYERKINVWGIVADYNEKNWLENVKSSTPQFHTSYFDMYFDRTRSIYKPGREVEGSAPQTWNIGPAKENIVFSDFNTGKVKAQKQVYEQKFIVEDSLRQMVWKEKDEIRTIANYKCRKAVGIICDSVYVVAFYAEDIPAAAGPEMFGGLPGMILQLAIPRLHTTWTATKVEIIQVKDADFSMPDKGKKVDQKGLYETIQSSLKDWGKWGTKYIYWTVL
jgi:GLPGLI family protein